MTMRFAFAALLLAAAACAHAQDANPPAPASASAAQVSGVPAATPLDQATKDNTATLDTITVTAQRPEEIDLYKFKNPIDPKTTPFSKDYHEPPSMQEIGENGGIIPYAVGYLLNKASDAARKIPGYKVNQPRHPHPPPLTDEQLLRATTLQQQQDGTQQPPANP